MDLKDKIELSEQEAAPKQPTNGRLTEEEYSFLESFSRKERNKIYLKTDLHLVPFLMLLYLFANLDRYATFAHPSYLRQSANSYKSANIGK